MLQNGKDGQAAHVATLLGFHKTSPTNYFVPKGQGIDDLRLEPIWDALPRPEAALSMCSVIFDFSPNAYSYKSYFQVRRSMTDITQLFSSPRKPPATSVTMQTSPPTG